MAKHQPELKRKITKSLEGESDYTKGFLSGSNQFEIERTNELARVRTRGKEKKRDLRRNL